jgi:hypothetical protein
VHGGVVVFMLVGMRNTNPGLRVGRGPRRARSEWTAEVERWRQSGLGAPEYAQQHGLKVARLLWWSAKLKHGRKGTEARVDAGPGPVAFLPLRMRQERVESSASETGCIEVVLANGRRVRVLGSVNIAQLGRVLTAAEGGDPC